MQLSYSTEGNRYDKLKSAAEEMIREQITTRTERDMSVRPKLRISLPFSFADMLIFLKTSKMSTLEQTIAAQSAKIQKLRSDKSQLQSLLELEKSTITKLEFECKSAQTMLEGLKAQVTRFQEHVDTCTQKISPFYNVAQFLDFNGHKSVY